MSDTARITIAADESGVTITTQGALDLTNTQSLSEELQRASASVDNVVVDMRPAVFIDTAVLTYLAKAAKTLLSRGKCLRVIVKQGSHPHRVLETVGFGDVMNIIVEQPSEQP